MQRNVSPNEGKSRQGFYQQNLSPLPMMAIGADTKLFDARGKALRVGDRVMVQSNMREGRLLYNEEHGCYSVYYELSYPPFDVYRAACYSKIDRDLHPGEEKQLIRLEE